MSVLATIFLAAGLAAAAAEPLPPLPEGAFTYAVIPDTQRYDGEGVYVKKGKPPRKGPTRNVAFSSRVNWIADNIRTENIVFVSHMGDIIDVNNVAQWTFASNLLTRLDSKVPYSVSPGNHDMRSSVGDATLFNRFFPVGRFARQPGYAARFEGFTTPAGLFKSGGNANTCRLFEAGGERFVLVHLECNAPEPVLKWADEMLERYADRHAIVATHAYLGPLTQEIRKERPPIAHAEAKRLGRPVNPYAPEMLGRMRWNTAQYKEKDGTSGEYMWSRHFSRHANLFLVVCGDQSSVIAYRQQSVGEKGNVVSEVMQDYPRDSDASDWLRLYRFIPSARRLEVYTYSPSQGTLCHRAGFLERREDHQFTLPYPGTKKGN